MNGNFYVILVMFTACVCNFFSRAFPFLLFSGREKLPDSIEYLGNFLPPCVMAVLVVYCLKGISFVSVRTFVPEIIAVLCVIGLHLWKRNNLISIAGGTIIYMILVQRIFI